MGVTGFGRFLWEYLSTCLGDDHRRQAHVTSGSAVHATQTPDFYENMLGEPALNYSADDNLEKSLAPRASLRGTNRLFLQMLEEPHGPGGPWGSSEHKIGDGKMKEANVFRVFAR